MAINFPNSPAVNDTFTVGGIKFTFTGVKWESGAVVELSSDTTPTLGGNLDGGTKNITNVGVITATGFSGPLTGAVTGNVNGNATGLTGNPSIQVTNATVLGNLDVQGTTTTIDTAVTEVDSLAVEGSVGIGTTNPGNMLEISSNGLSKGLIITKNGTNAAFLGHNGSGNEGILTLKDGGTTKVIFNGETGQHSYINSGNLGIGTDNPSGMLEVQKNGVPAIISNYNNQRHIHMGAGFNGAGFHLTDGNFFTINHQPYADKGTDSNLTERFRITSGGEIYVGGSSTYNVIANNLNTAKLHLSGAGGGSANIELYGSNHTTPKMMTVSTNNTERLRITSAGTVQIGSSATINVQISPNTGLVINDGAIDCYQATSNSAAIPFKIQSDVGGTKVVKASITAGGVISDSIGPLRRLGVAAHSTNYTLQTSDAGKLLRDSAGSQFTIPPHPELAAGDMISIFNVSGSNMQVLQGSGVTLYNSADAATGTRTLAPKGMCTIICTASNEFVISGTQLT